MLNVERGLRIQLSEIRKVFAGPTFVEALKETSWSVSSGAYVSIAGASGSGKSTLLSILGCMSLPTSGQCYWDGVDVTTLSERQRTKLRREHVGFVFQAYHLISHLTVAENVSLALKYQRFPRPERKNRVRRAVEQVGLGPRADFFPGLLSGGEQQRVAIARAIVGTPRLLLCDEPTGNLDTQSGLRVMSALEGQAANGTTLVIVTHDPQIAARAETRVRIDNGTLVP